MEHVYWNPTMETMPREQLRALQDERLQRRGDAAYTSMYPSTATRCSSWASRPTISTAWRICTYLPFTEKKDLRNNYPFGLFAVPQSEIVRIHASSGTTGKPSVAGYTSGDIDRLGGAHGTCHVLRQRRPRTISCRWPMATACLPAGWARTTARSAVGAMRDSHERRQYRAPAHADGGLRLNGTVLHAFLCAQPGRCHGARRHRRWTASA